MAIFANDDADENIPIATLCHNCQYPLPEGGGHTPSYLPFGEETMSSHVPLRPRQASVAPH